MGPIRIKKKRGRKPLNYVVERETPVPVEQPASESTPTVTVPPPSAAAPVQKLQILPTSHLPRMHVVQVRIKFNISSLN